MIAYLTFSLLLSLFYSYVIFSALKTWHRLSKWRVPPDFQPKTILSILIPARDEEANITACLTSVVNQSYPTDLFEIIVVNDHSTDRTADLVLQLQTLYSNIKLLHLADFTNSSVLNSYKKKALEIGVAYANGELIVTTDADCVAPPNWLQLLASLYETRQPRCICAPVNFHQEKNLLERFQSLDYAGTMLLTGAGIHARTLRLSNGANLAYPKAVFEELQGFADSYHLASGDDMMLVHKIAGRYPDGIVFLKNAAATVLTTAKATWRDFWQQRIRWATKSTAYPDRRVTGVVAMVFFYCCNILLSILLIPFVGWQMTGIFLLQLVNKLYWDSRLLYTACVFFNKKELLKAFLPAQLLHIWYIIVIGILGNTVKKYEWKGRKVR
jgi:cellulose synthase/poly-beta-1,6-N-acetylglucosamine synthase-like glycosyltransferase